MYELSLLSQCEMGEENYLTKATFDSTAKKFVICLFIFVNVVCAMTQKNVADQPNDCIW